VGAVLLVAAEAFRRGAQLEEDQAFTALEAVCRELGCQPGDLLAYVPATEPVEEGV
jgi:hypothetical protein